MTPIGHISVSHIFGKSMRNISLPSIIIGGLLPDIDFAFIFFDWFNQYHHVITHNLLFISFAALVGAVVASGKLKKRIGISLLLGSLLHLAIDSFLDNNPSNGIGVALLWPFYGELFSPFNLLTPSGIENGWSEPMKMIRPMLFVMLYELPFYAISVFVLLRENRLGITSE
ncbi:MAG: metal-dependent hydrolase [Nitrospiraceae bacterium]|nr:MAG: metal-dependent hydrolase [Nitrospiraceae bacterium]